METQVVETQVRQMTDVNGDKWMSHHYLVHIQYLLLGIILHLVFAYNSSLPSNRLLFTGHEKVRIG